MTEKLSRVLICDECSERSQEVRPKYDYHHGDWITARLWRGAPDFTGAMKDGPRGMRDELEGISAHWLHLCPACVATLRAFLLESFPNAFGPTLGVPRPLPPLDDDDEIPF